ncbi:MAG: hypothetical protein AB8C84_11035 [Oligoflexales bacterium]
MMRHRSISFVKKCLQSLILLSQIFGIPLHAESSALPKLSTKSIQIHPFHFSRDQFSLSFPEGHSTTVPDWVTRLIQPQVPHLKLHISKTQYKNSSEIYDISFSYKGTPLCEAGLRAKKMPQGALVTLGQVPTLNIEDTNDDDIAWPLKQDMPLWNQAQHPKKAKRCWVPYQNILKPAWEWTQQDPDGSYRVVADTERFYQKEPLFFKATASIQAYATGPIDANLVVYELQVADTGYLDNDYFTVDPGTVSRAFSSDYNFVYSPTEIEFHEASVFAHAEETRLFFTKYGWNWTEETPLHVLIHATPNNSKNNGLYEPGTSYADGKARISLGDGDGERLAYLSLDADVISHEFAHHVIYRHLKASSRESLVLHEGLADAFTFLRTGNTCLGESICPDSPKSICSLPKECLRSGGTTLKYNSLEYEALSGKDHLRGQVISGMVWDLKASIEDEKLIKTNLKALEFLYRTSGLQDWLVALMAADQEINNGDHSCDIYQAAITRGFEELLTDIDCARPTTWPSLNGLPNTSATTKTEEASSDDSSISCGTIGFTYPVISIFWFFIPLLINSCISIRQRGPH